MTKAVEKLIMKDFDKEKYFARYCEKLKCNDCVGTDYDGELKKYGCTDRDIYIDERYKSILKRRIKQYDKIKG